MYSLVLDSSSKSAAAGLYEDDRLLADAFLESGPTHSETLAPMLAHLLAQSRLRGGDVGRVVVTNGPGSFTGLRIGTAAALGFAYAAGAEIFGVSSLEAAAQGAVYADGVICACMDARRQQVYSATFCAAGGALERLTEDAALPVTELIEKNREMTVLYVGDGAHLCYNDEKDRLWPELRYIRAAGIWRCFAAGHTRPADKLAYLRLPQAERERLERLAHGPPTIREN